MWDRTFAGSTYGTQTGENGPHAAKGLAVDPSGDVYLTGWVGDQVALDFDPGSGTAYLNGFDPGPTVPGSLDSRDVFLVRLDTNGNYVAARHLGSAATDQGWGLAVDSGGAVYLGGFFGRQFTSQVTNAGPGTFDIGDQTVTLDAGSGGGFLVKLDPSYGAVSGRVIRDANGNGLDDDGFGLEGWTIYLDNNGNGQLDAGEPTSITDARGIYTFDHLLAGTHTVAVVPRAGWGMTKPGSATVTLASGQFYQQTFGTTTATTVRTYTSANVPVNTVHQQWVTSTVTIPDGFTIFDIDVLISATHTKVQELWVNLSGPDGTDVRLSKFPYIGAGKNFTNTIFDQEAAQRLAEGKAPYTGHFRPAEPIDGLSPGDPALSWWNGQLTAGTWTLKIKDGGTTTTGTLTNWALIITKDSDPLPPPAISIDEVSLTEGNAGP